MLDFDWVGAETSYLRALALNPSAESAHRAYALLLSALGRHRDAVRESDRVAQQVAGMGQTLMQSQRLPKSV